MMRAYFGKRVKWDPPRVMRPGEGEVGGKKVETDPAVIARFFGIN